VWSDASLFSAQAFFAPRDFFWLAKISSTAGFSGTQTQEEWKKETPFQVEAMLLLGILSRSSFFYLEPVVSTHS
jgi:hypothetical protein